MYTHAVTRWQTAAVLAVAVAIFFFVAGPVWRHPWSIDGSVYWSYAAIPLLVAGVLLMARRFRWRAFLIGTLEVTLFKFGITYGIAIVLWATAGEPPPAPSVVMPAGTPAPSLAKKPPEKTGELAGRAPPGALVWIDGGLDEFAFPPPSGTIEMQNDGHGFAPAIVSAQVGQTLKVRATDGRTHTLHAKDDRTGALRNLAVPAGAPRAVRFTRPLGLVEVTCLVHALAHSEKPSWLLVVAHPFVTRADGQGRFAWQGVPAVRVRVEAFDPAHGRAITDAEVRASGRAEVTLEVGAQIQ